MEKSEFRIVYPWTKLSPDDPYEDKRIKYVWPKLKEQDLEVIKKPDEYLVNITTYIIKKIKKIPNIKLMIVSNNVKVIKGVSESIPSAYALTFLKSVLYFDSHRFNSVVSFSSENRYYALNNILLRKSGLVFFRSLINLGDTGRPRSWSTPQFFDIVDSWGTDKRAFIFTMYVPGSWSAEILDTIKLILTEKYGIEFTDYLFSNLYVEIFDNPNFVDVKLKKDGVK